MNFLVNSNQLFDTNDPRCYLKKKNIHEYEKMSKIISNIKCFETLFIFITKKSNFKKYFHTGFFLSNVIVEKVLNF